MNLKMSIENDRFTFEKVGDWTNFYIIYQKNKNDLKLAYNEYIQGAKFHIGIAFDKEGNKINE